MKNVIQMLQNAAEKYSDTCYVAGKEGKKWVTYSFAEVYKLSRNLAAYLITHYNTIDNKYIILSEGRSNWVVSELAVIMTRSVSVPISIKLQAEEIAFRVNHSEAKAVFVSKNYFEKIASVSNEFENKKLKFILLDNDKKYTESIATKYNINKDNILFFDEIIKQGEELLQTVETKIDNLIAGIDINDTVTISYTSGTTGNPKGIMLTHKNYYANCTQAVKTFRVPEKTYKSLLILPCDHSFAHTVGIFAALLRGISLYFVDARGGGMNA